MARRKRYEVRKLSGKLEKRISTPRMALNGDGSVKLDKHDNPIPAGGFDHEMKKVDAGWMVFLPSGASLHIWTEAEMKRQGFNIDGEAEEMDEYEAGDYEEIAKRKSDRGKSSNFEANA